MTSKEIKKLIISAKNVAIFGHKNPDLDCFGALFGAKFLCERLGAKATIFSNPPKNSFLLNIFDKKEIESEYSSENFDLVMILDCNNFLRLEEKYREEVAKKDNILVIDHHPQVEVENGCKFLVDKNKSSASLIVLEILNDLKIPLTKEVATYIYAGVVGDTGRFLHTNTDVATFEGAIALLKSGADIQKVYDVVYRSKTLQQIKIRDYLFSIYKLSPKNICHLVVSKKMLEKVGGSVEDVKLFIDDLNQIKEFNVVMMAYELESETYKVSCRSKNGYEVAGVAVRHGGGGHKMAAGFTLKGNAKDVGKALEKISEEF